MYSPYSQSRCSYLNIATFSALFLCFNAVFTKIHAATPDEVTTVAFIADQGVNDNSKEVLKLIRNEGADLLLVQGDLGYGKGPDTWTSMMDDVLGRTFPVLAVVGNHDRTDWAIYQKWLETKIPLTAGLQCEGNIGVKSQCHYRGISIVQTAPGIRDVSPENANNDYAAYVNNSFESDDGNWRICSFHKNQSAMQTGFKSNEAGWPIYQACLAAGAIIATGHEHAYSRTWLMDDFEKQSVVHRRSHMSIKPGQSIAFVSGLGGVGKRWQWRRGHWWAKVLTRWQNASYGALFCHFKTTTAQCEFKDIKGQVRDAFTIDRNS